jgi:hypothetical protein
MRSEFCVTWDDGWFYIGPTGQRTHPHYWPPDRIHNWLWQHAAQKGPVGYQTMVLRDE